MGQSITHICTKWGKWPFEGPYPSCSIPLMIFLFLLHVARVCQDKQTSQQLSRGLGLLWKICRGFLPTSATDSLSLSLSLTHTNLKCFPVPIFSGMEKTQTACEKPLYPVSPQHRPQSLDSRCVVHVQVCSMQLTQCEAPDMYVETHSPTFERERAEGGGNRSAFNRAPVLTHHWTLAEPVPRTHLTPLIPHSAVCPCF